MSDTMLMRETAFLVALAEHGMPPGVGEVLMYGEPGRVPPGALRKALAASDAQGMQLQVEETRDD